MTVRRGPENIWRGPEIPFLKSSTKIMNKQVLKDFDKKIKEYPNNQELKQHREEFIHNKKG
jgi:hypothetical protein